MGNFFNPGAAKAPALPIAVGSVDLVNAAKGATLNISQLVQAFSTLSSSLQGAATQQNFVAGSGWQQFTTGLVLNWGSGSTTTGSGTISFGLPFPTACFVVLLTSTGSGSATQNNLIASSTPSQTGCSVFCAAAASLTFFYLAIGH
jgi:hypothetical protein